MRFKGRIRELDLDNKWGKLTPDGLERLGFMWEGEPNCVISKMLIKAMAEQAEIQMDLDEDWHVIIVEWFRPGVFNNDDLL